MSNYKFIDKSVYLEKEKILVMADLHLGYEDALKEQGVFLPKFQYKKIIEDLEKIFSVVGKVKEVVILGDLKHEFGTISSQEWKEVLSLFDFLKKKTGKIILIRGNHDNYLINIVKRQGIKLVDFYIKGNFGFIHGHKIFSEIFDTSKSKDFECHQKSERTEKISEEKIKTIFLGHLHPAITITKGVKKETYKCFLVGKFKGTENYEFSVSQTPHKNKQGVCDKEIVILPSFFPLVEGADVVVEDTNLAFKPNLREFEVFVVGDEVYDFGKLIDVRRLISWLFIFFY